LLATVSSNVLDFMNNTAVSNATDAISSAALPSASALATTDGTLTVLQTLSSGLQARFTGASGTTVNPFSRVDFYRYSASNQYDYLGSSSATPTTTVTAGALAEYTFSIGTYAAVTPTGAVTTVAAAGNDIIAIGVRSNGLGTKTASTVIGGAYLRVDLAGLPSGVSVPVTITGPNSFTTTVTAGNGFTNVPVSFDGTYTATYGQYSPSTGGVSAPTSATISVTAAGNGAFAFAQNVYVFSGIRAEVTINGLPTGKTTSLVFSATGQNSVTFTAVSNGTANYTLPAAATWTITPTATVTSAGAPTTGLIYAPLSSTSAATTTVVAAFGSTPVAAASTMTYTLTSLFLTTVVTVPAGITLTPSFTFASNALSNKTFASMTGGASSVATATNYVIYGTAASAVTTANPVVVGSTTYGVPVATVSQTETPSIAGFTTAAMSTFAYNSARATIVFDDSTGFTGGLADLANYPIAISLTNGSVVTSLGAFSPGQNTAAANAAAPTTGVVLAASALLGPVAIPSITIGTDVYTFSYPAASGAARLYDYDVNAKVIYVKIKKN
jgi:hypothetical protein